MCLKYEELNQFISRVRSLILGTTDPCIATLSFFSKVLERLIFNQLDLFLEKMIIYININLALRKAILPNKLFLIRNY